MSTPGTGRSGKGAPLQSALESLPNWLSLFRLLSSPAIAALLLIDAYGLRVVAAILFAVASITDYLDGYLARRMKVVSSLGVFMDLAADKILVSTVLIILTGTGAVPSWMAAVIVAREFIVAGLRSQAAAKGVSISASQLGKWKTAITLVALLLAVLALNHTLVLAGLWLTTAITIASALDYIASHWKVMFHP
ncbi:MAG TPA: CDP-diacylglycerol--glycerol-3-phosphate 3-phosphatidyltransferase [Chloroflexota bacterium]|nr:CDP-diacylglycerol--glycerol-3-phosphate 3-phosphatidyltransferase [Chloroflexota bacterium]